jgi:hypothetical protein
MFNKRASTYAQLTPQTSWSSTRMNATPAFGIAHLPDIIEMDRLGSLAGGRELAGRLAAAKWSEADARTAVGEAVNRPGLCEALEPGFECSVCRPLPTRPVRLRL